MDLEREKGAVLLKFQEVLHRERGMKGAFNDARLASLEYRLGKLIEEEHTCTSIQLRLRERGTFQNITQGFLDHIFL